MEKSQLEPNELFFILSPPPAIVDYVAMLKRHIRTVIGHPFEDEFSRAHISLFKYKAEHAEDLLYRIDNKISVINPFQVFVKDLNYSSHGNTRTIHLEIVHKNPICEILERLVNADANFTPYITIAKNLDMNDFLTAWNSLKNLSYSQNFRCDHITVLKKAPRKWVHYIDLPFAA